MQLSARDQLDGTEKIPRKEASGRQLERHVVIVPRHVALERSRVQPVCADAEIACEDPRGLHLAREKAPRDDNVPGHAVHGDGALSEVDGGMSSA